MKPRKKWDPVYRFGGNPADYFTQAPLGENQYHIPMKPKPKKGKRK